MELADLQVALKDMARACAPGPDGFPVEYYTEYAHVLLPHLLDTLMEARQVVILPRSMSEATIVMLPKPDKDPTIPGPLSMMGVDVKLFPRHWQCN